MAVRGLEAWKGRPSRMGRLKCRLRWSTSDWVQPLPSLQLRITAPRTSWTG